MPDKSKWGIPTKIKIKKISGNWAIPNEYIIAQCSNCHNCFLMLEHKGETNYKYCPNCGAEMETRLFENAR